MDLGEKSSPDHNQLEAIMQLPESAAIKPVTINEMILNVAEPFMEGHPLTEEESNVLNQTFRENIRNNFAPRITEAREKGEADPVLLQGKLDEYVLEYKFGERKGGGLRASDPVTAAMKDIAREAVRRAIKKSGGKIKDYDTKDINKKADDLIGKHETVIRQRATERVEAAKDLEEDVVASLKEA